VKSDELIETARAQTGLDDLGDIPYAEPLDVIVDSLNREARLDEDREQAAATTLVGLLAKRLRLVDDRKRNPSIADEKIVAPVFILGLPRTGSTHLHALMAQVDGIRTPRYWEMQLPSPPPEAATFDTDPRIAQIQAVLDHIPEEMLQRHPMAPNRPEQCNMLNDWSLIHQALLAYYEIPSYRDWLFNADYRPAFEAHRRTLQHLQWHAPGQWVLKYPKHLIALEVLLETYPDAHIIWTHRDPGVVIPSVCSFTGYIRSANPSYDPLRYGPEWTLFEELVLRRGLSVRDRMPDADTRIHDLHYRDLMADPVGAVGRAFDQFDIPFSDESARSVQAWIDAHPQTEHGVHRYTAEEFGLDRDHLRERFSFYTERFGVAPEVRA
jgi:sulfotransferase family protein